MKYFNLIAGIAVLLTSYQSFGWGKAGHSLIGEVAAEIATGSGSFWDANSENFGKLANVPDYYWKSLPTSKEERPTHFFEPDGYFNDPSQFVNFPRRWSEAVQQYGEAKLKDHGTSVWRAQQFYGIVVESLRAGDYKAAVEMAGAMTHYVGDMSQPLHVTTQYDGRTSDQAGIHRFFESQNLEKKDYEKMKAEVRALALKLMSDKTFLAANAGTVESSIFNEVDRAYAHADEVLTIDEKLGRKATGASKMYDLAKQRMADGAATLALVLRKAWAASQNPKMGETVQIETPAWVAPDYSNAEVRARMQRLDKLSFFKAPDVQPSGDCY